jgi:predicted nucleic acid-binding protein
VLYADTSALAKLVVDEPESAALEAFLTQREDVVTTSALTWTELLRVAVAVGSDDEPNQDALVKAEQVLQGVTVVLPGITTFETAGRLTPRLLRSLDAIHLATALETHADEFLVYDRRLRDAALSHGLVAVSPG